ncbi:hypothetical protein Xcel_2066 [Xylanimonas cellulosilytica DSM 15894]|uniref:Uncharacterized protein n=1 Tax=Xylanimonas cellulosilytica (strain DSM 15894 / JCM 12276 / CECT 5975 / KCTC 9989 / LMG 20990 / NBRC 107835 / XIL07) TaxID=446471 RepID=D1BU71_XYLCX|nr:hypothetical protein [Xylanimonas cellulosilytica]ACZ31084.1 hypothetical protein Xcel_2066 [Xylanimonas cellulosilytica DSM 15894]
MTTSPARSLALRTMRAVADDNRETLTATLRAAAGQPGGVMALIVALAEAANANAQALAPDDWREQLAFIETVEEES